MRVGGWVRRHARSGAPEKSQSGGKRKRKTVARAARTSGWKEEENQEKEEEAPRRSKSLSGLLRGKKLEAMRSGRIRKRKVKGSPAKGFSPDEEVGVAEEEKQESKVSGKSTKGKGKLQPKA